MRWTSLLWITMLLAACRGPQESAEESPDPTPPEAVEQESEGPKAREADPMLDTGIMLRSPEGRNWGVHLQLPVSLGWTSFGLDESVSLDNLATIAVVPTAEFIVPLGERWTLLPYAGLGFGWQTGAAEVVGGGSLLGLATGGVRATRWQHYSERNWFGFTGDFKYTSVIGGSAGVLGDWGSLSAAVELRRDFGAPREGARFQGGVYLQGLGFWDPVELDLIGVSPEVVKANVELGISLGSTETYKVLGIALPRVFIGYFKGDGISGVRVRFGRL